ncbi:hypothetical protein HPB50_024954 [Hyalomma asiaticum]|uniref:Uncharacterized protein n=1 Tax=Hyalomma asiaticum TaxID=266040 RepID=A0ACB7TSX8_HYAAI|nr:hypothetical protein HPB50_024954 [Hyalomma asiaticum]
MSALIKASQLRDLLRWERAARSCRPARAVFPALREHGSATIVNGRDSVARDSRPHRFYRLKLADSEPRSPKSLTLHTSSTRGAPRTVCSCSTGSRCGGDCAFLRNGAASGSGADMP